MISFRGATWILSIRMDSTRLGCRAFGTAGLGHRHLNFMGGDQQAKRREPSSRTLDGQVATACFGHCGWLLG